MNAKFKKWVVDEYEKFTGKDRREFLKILKTDPTGMTMIIRASFYQWVSDAWKRDKIMACDYDLNKHVEEILKELQTHFAKELEDFR